MRVCHLKVVNDTRAWPCTPAALVQMRSSLPLTLFGRHVLGSTVDATVA